ncbi:MlaE family ABC transporter permease [Granulibacter bethesdensis]|uniref:MlaE family ABC transporter permease n=2 Tax=Granulibacter bethesdensis TaxID=364410 RepID=UPI0003F1EF24|nr:ABC transporter permease [Granulibacter bethesdensis]AHJ66116.1 ABC transporter permease protein [Granulibacter bethesdensis CGDNIH4]
MMQTATIPAQSFARVRLFLRVIGRGTRNMLRFLLIMVAASAGVVLEVGRPSCWRRTTRAAFGQTLHQAAGGGVISTLFTATLVGIAMISQAIYWLGFAGMVESTGTILATILLRELSPILVGIILLGRSGMPMISELGMLSANGHIRTLEAQGIDPFILIIVPRTIAFTVSAFTLGMVFAVTALCVGFAVATEEGLITQSLWGFLTSVTGSMSELDYIIIPLKLMVVGFLVGLSSCLTGLSAQTDNDLQALLSRGFARGILTVMIVNILFTVTV